MSYQRTQEVGHSYSKIVHLPNMWWSTLQYVNDVRHYAYRKSYHRHAQNALLCHKHNRISTLHHHQYHHYIVVFISIEWHNIHVIAAINYYILRTA